jgi:D-alanine transaminase
MAELDPVYLDRGVFFGDGVYEVLRSYGGKIFALDEHLKRFEYSLSEAAIDAVDIDLVRHRVLKAFEIAGISNAKLYFHVTRGSQLRKHLCDSELEPNFFLTVTEVQNDTQDKAEGVAVSTHPDWRWKRCDIKSLNLLANVLARKDAAAKGCDEAILVDETGFITEGASSAFFAISGHTLQTAALTANILPSITRQFVIKAAENIELKPKEESLTPRQACDADELFIASTTNDIIPVIRFDGRTIGDGRPGKHTKLLIREFLSFTTS